MMKLLRESTLEEARTQDLERLAKWLDILPSDRHRETEKMWRRALIYAILRKEKQLSKLPRSKRHERP